jgi:hypothetical protein
MLLLFGRASPDVLARAQPHGGILHLGYGLLYSSGGLGASLGEFVLELEAILNVLILPVVFRLDIIRDDLLQIHLQLVSKLHAFSRLLPEDVALLLNGPVFPDLLDVFLRPLQLIVAHNFPLILVEPLHHLVQLLQHLLLFELEGVRRGL